MSNVVNWFEIYVEDMARAKSFYGNVLQKEMMDMDGPEGGEMCAFPWEEGAANAAGALVRHEMGKPGMGGTIVYFECEDCASEESRIAPNGGQVVKPKFSIGEYGFITLAMDTEGNMIGFHSRK